MSLTDAEKACGRLSRDYCTSSLLNGITADAFCPPYITWYRHPCKLSERAVQSGTWAMWTRQSYVKLGPCKEHGVPDGKFAFVFRFGECSRCGLRVRSIRARFVIVSENPPEKGANVGWQPAHGDLLAHQADYPRSS